VVAAAAAAAAEGTAPAAQYQHTSVAIVSYYVGALRVIGLRVRRRPCAV